MSLTYSDFMKIIPDETKKYVEKLMPLLQYYIIEENSLKYPYLSESAKILTCCIKALEDTKYVSYIKERGYKKGLYESINTKTLTNKEKENIYDTVKSLFKIYDDDTMYYSLLPIDILEKAFILRKKHFHDSINGDSYYNLYYDHDTRIRDDIRGYVEECHQKLDAERENEIFGKLSFEVIHYLETASKIRTLLIEKINNSTKSKILNNDKYLVPISLLLALYEYDGEEKNAIEKYLENQALSLEKLYNYLDLNISKNISKTKVSLDAIKYLYLEYFKYGNNYGKDASTIKIADVIPNLINREFTGSTSIENILNGLKIPISIFENLGVDQEEKINLEAKTFKNNLRKDTQKFIIFSCKTYQLLLTKMQEGKHNKDMLNTEEDADTLAVYIAGHYYNTVMDRFYSSNGVTFDKVLNLLKISITKDEIDNIEIDNKILLDRFKRFVTDGVNVNLNKKTITIDRTLLNLTNREFNKSIIMEDIYEDITEKELNSNFIDSVNDFIKEEQRKKREDYLIGFPIENVEYLTMLSFIFKEMLNKNLNGKYGLENCKVLAILLTSFKLEKNNISKFLKTININYDNIKKNIPDFNKNNYIFNDQEIEIDIDILTNYFNEYIFGGYNKDLNKNEINIIDIINNAFNKDIYDSVFLNQLYAKISFDSNKYNEKELRKEYLKYIEIEKQQQEIQKYLDSLNPSVKKILIKANTYYDSYSSKLDQEQLIVLSYVLALIDYKNEEYDKMNLKYLENRGFSRDKLLKYFKVEDIIYNQNEINYNTFIILKEYIQPNPKDILFSLLDNDIFNKFLKTISINANEIKRELIYNKDFEDTLDVDTALEYLEKLEVEDITFDNMRFYGNSLYSYKKCISKLYSDIIKTNSIEESKSSIIESIDNIYIEEKEENNGFLSILIPSKPVTKERTIDINQMKIDELNIIVHNNLKKLIAINNNYDKLKKYLLLIITKDKQYIEKTEEFLRKIQSGEIKVSNTGIKDLDESEKNKIIEILKTKINELKITDYNYAYEIEMLNNYMIQLTKNIDNLYLAETMIIPKIVIQLGMNNSLEIQKESAQIVGNSLKALTILVEDATNGTSKVLEIMENNKIMTPEEIEAFKRNEIEVEATEVKTDSIDTDGQVIKLKLDGTNK